MKTEFEYYYNDVPGKGLCRNNLIYTSLISKDKRTFCQWYYNDTDYHKGHNEVVDTSLMEEKWNREIQFITKMTTYYPDLVPKILDIDYKNKKLYLEIDGPDFWQLACPVKQNYDSVLPDWQNQMLEIFKAHKALGIYKYSLHPSSYFVANGKLKSINYFFCYTDDDTEIKLRSVMSHVSKERQEDLFSKMKILKIDLDKTTSFRDIQILAFESFKTNFSNGFMDLAKEIYI